jgi:4-amino-4-deoxy-L-arabinose transferase-like glycosyltransferase
MIVEGPWSFLDRAAYLDGMRGVERLSKGVVLIGGVVFAVLMALATRYGFHRDELYFLDCSRHLQASYVDQPIFVPLLTRLSTTLFGTSLIGLRLWPALAAWVTVLLGGLIARELGGGRRAQLLAALATATMPVALGAAHLMGPTAFDIPATAALALVALRVERTADPRWWLAGGLVLGLGLSNKHSIGFFAVALTAGILLTGAGAGAGNGNGNGGSGRKLVLNRWFALGALIAALFVLPELWWQSRHGWAAAEMTATLNRQNGGPANIPVWVIGQFLVIVTPAAAWIWVAGLRHLWRSAAPVRRGLVWAYAILFVFYAVTAGAKVYYLSAAYVYLLAGGAVAVEGWLAVRKLRAWTAGLAAAVTTAALLPIVLPVLPPARIGWTYGINDTLGETVGWPQLAGAVRTVWSSLPAEQRRDTVIFTADYGEAGAIDTLDRGAGMPAAVSGQNSLWWWGPGDPDASTVIAVGPGPVDGTGFADGLRREFTEVRPAATLTNPYGIHNQEWHGQIYVCTGPIRPWGQIWPLTRHYD